MLVSDKVFCDRFVCFISPAAWLFGGLFHTFFDWMDKLVNENMEVNTSWTHVERENDSGHMKRARKE